MKCFIDGSVFSALHYKDMWASFCYPSAFQDPTNNWFLACQNQNLKNLVLAYKKGTKRENISIQDYSED